MGSFAFCLKTGIGENVSLFLTKIMHHCLLFNVAELLLAYFLLEIQCTSSCPRKVFNLFLSVGFFFFFLVRSSKFHFCTFFVLLYLWTLQSFMFGVVMWEGGRGYIFFILYSTIIPNDVGHSKSVAMAVVSGFKSPYSL